MKESIRHLDQRFKGLRPLCLVGRPQKGWVRAVRNALGMTAKQMAERLGVSQPRITELEKAEISGSITLRSLERAAEALGCRVVYALVPERPLADSLQKRAEYLATQQLGNVQQTMNLEDQAVSDEAVREEMRKGLVERLLNKPSRLWDER